MDKIFAQTLKILTFGTFKPSKPSPSELIFKNCHPSLFLHRQYKLSVAAVWWYFLVRLWVKLFVSKRLIEAFFGLFDGHRMTCCNIPCSYWKNINLEQRNKDSNPSPHKCSLIIALLSLGRKFIVWLCKETII